MIGLDLLLFGYVKYTVKSEDVGRCAELFLKAGKTVKFRQQSFFVRLSKCREIEKIIAGRVEFKKGKISGLGGFLWCNKKRYGAISALVLVSFLLVFSSTRVWDVRVTGCSPEKQKAVLSELSSAGFTPGSSWLKSDLGRIEAKLLSESDTVSWLNINRRGNVAYVSVIEKETHKPPPEKVGYSNLVAASDAIIEEITVIHGEAAVKVGDSVKRGDLLISGVIPSEAGGGFCYAEGIVRGRVSDTVTVEVSSKRVEKYVKSSKLCDARLNIFNFSAKIYKYYRNLPNECVIIEKRDNASFLGKGLPFSIQKKYAVTYGENIVELSHDEMTRLASQKMQQLLSERLESATLLKIKTEAEIFPDRYIMRTGLICTENIGVDLPFDAPDE